MTKHTCQKDGIIEELSLKLKTQKQLGEETFASIESVKIDLDEHREAQRAHEAVLNNTLADISGQMQQLLDLNSEVNDFRTAWKVGKRIGFGLAAFITLVSIISGGIWGLKEWIKK